MKNDKNGMIRSMLPGLAVVTVGAAIGILAAPTPAAASTENTGYTCYQYDVCMPGSAPCCFEIIEIQPGGGRCSTMC